VEGLYLNNLKEGNTAKFKIKFQGLPEDYGTPSKK